MQRRRCLWLAVVVAVALGPLIGPGVPASAQQQPAQSITIRLLEASAERRDDPRSRVYVNDHLAPGETISRRIEVTNTTGRPQRLEFYAAAAEVAGGTFVIGDGRASNELTEWMSVEPSAATLPDGGSQVLTVDVRVPPDAEEGERYAAVLAERPADPAAPGTVSTGTRVGIRVYLSVGPGGEPRSDFSIEDLTAARTPDGAPAVTASVRNTGGRALDLAGTLDLGNGPGGLSAGPFDVQLGTTLAPGQTAPVTVVLDEALPDGPWRALLKLRSGRDERAAEATIRFPSPGQQADPVAAVEVPLDEGNPWVIAAGVLIGLLALLLLLFLLLKRRSRRDEHDEVDAAGEPVGV